MALAPISGQPGSRPVDDARNAAQRAFFETALRPPQIAAAPNPQPVVASAPAPTLAGVAEDEDQPPVRTAWPGSRVNIVV
jgi:hypothetical protein